MFEPIAIVGRACLLPGAHTPEQLWQNSLAKKNSLQAATEAIWGIDPQKLLTKNLRTDDHIATDRCGFIQDFLQIFEAEGFHLSQSAIQKWDVILSWLLYTGRAALYDAGLAPAKMKKIRAGAIIGNLGYPTTALGKLGEWICLNQQPQKKKISWVDPINRFSTALPLFKMAEGLGLTQTVYGIDAACASSLYAIKLACDELHQGTADYMIAGGINAVDSLFLQMGFSALRALSPSGNSLPFHQQADGLIPSQGSALVVLKRLHDAIAMNDQIYGVIRGMGLSNDGSGKTLLTPTEAGQIAAMHEAYQQAALDPVDVSWVECHATGTPLGDATEIRSMHQIFQPKKSLSIGALKANIGHSITASGAAALINVLSAIQAKIKPPALTANHPMPLLSNHGFTLHSQPHTWEISGKTRLAAINCFGFGGNNAHLIVEEFQPKVFSQKNKTKPQTQIEAIAVVGIGILLGNIPNKTIFSEVLKNKQKISNKIENITLALDETPFPPVDLKSSLGQQLAIIRACHEALDNIQMPVPERSSVLIGMQCDAEITRFGLRWRLSTLLPDMLDKDWLKKARDIIRPTEQAADIVGCMPNIVTNRMNHIFNFKAPSYSVFAEELSGIQALQIGIRELREQKIDIAVIGAVDLSCEMIHETAMRAIFPENKLPADAAIVFALKRFNDAKKNNEKIYGLIEKIDFHHPSIEENNLNHSFGHAHAASGLLELTTALLDKNNPQKIALNVKGSFHRSAKITGERGCI